jgi:hypothetical protein
MQNLLLRCLNRYASEKKLLSPFNEMPFYAEREIWHHPVQTSMTRMFQDAPEKSRSVSRFGYMQLLQKYLLTDWRICSSKV